MAEGEPNTSGHCVLMDDRFSKAKYCHSPAGLGLAERHNDLFGHTLTPDCPDSRSQPVWGGGRFITPFANMSQGY